METIKITKDAAQQAINTATGNLKDTLTALFGNQLWPADPIEAFNSFDDICKTLGEVPLHSFQDPFPGTIGEVMALAAVKLEMIFRAYNTNPDGTIWEPDYADNSQKKWYGWFEWSPSASAFVFHSTDYTYTCTCLGARLCTNTEAKMKDIGTKFIKEINEFLNPQLSKNGTINF